MPVIRVARNCASVTLRCAASPKRLAHSGPRSTADSHGSNGSFIDLCPLLVTNVHDFDFPHHLSVRINASTSGGWPWIRSLLRLTIGVRQERDLPISTDLSK